MYWRDQSNIESITEAAHQICHEYVASCTVVISLVQQNVISGSVTTVTVDCGDGPRGGGSGSGDRHQEEVNRLKMDKLELLRQNVSSQREVQCMSMRGLHLKPVH